MKTAAGKLATGLTRRSGNSVIRRRKAEVIQIAAGAVGPGSANFRELVTCLVVEGLRPAQRGRYTPLWNQRQNRGSQYHSTDNTLFSSHRSTSRPELNHTLDTH